MNLIPLVKLSRTFWIATSIVAVAALCGWMGVSPKRPFWVPNGIIPPADAKAVCTVAPPLFNSWFTSGAVTLNGAVNPANSITFPNVANCSFYQWSYQMFLWLTSPAPPQYGGGGGHVFNSPVFFGVTPPDSLGIRHFIRQSEGIIPTLAIRVAQVGPHGLQVIFSSAGSMFEIVDPVFADNGQQLILNSSGQQVAIAKSAIVNGAPAFFDITGAQIESPRPIIPSSLQQLPVVQGFPIAGITHFLGVSGAEVDMEQGQAGGNAVLRSRYGSLVYYATFVNDVYTYFTTGAKNGSILPRPVHFPTTHAQLDQIIPVGIPDGATFPDSVALAIEMKSSWVEAASLPDPANYITMTATIPTYDTTNPTNWVVNGQKTTTLAMVGVHVVGSTAGHPEMIWSTFEHFENTPNGTFAYINNGGATVTVPQNTVGNWVFSDNGTAGPFNIEHMFYSAGHIIAEPGFNVTYSNTLREKAWGASIDKSPNPIDATPAASNTEIISINNSVRGQLIPGDVRENYILGGATWTENGLIPTLPFPSGNVVGTSKLCNSTLETYQQGSDNTFATGATCFSCHNSTPEGDGLADTAVSHIYPVLLPLFGPGSDALHAAAASALATQFPVPAQQERIRLYPNPADGVVNVEVVVNSSGNARIVIGDMSGRINAQQTSYLQTGTNLVSIPVSALAAGSYFIKVYKADGSKSLIASFFKQ